MPQHRREYLEEGTSSVLTLEGHSLFLSIFTLPYLTIPSSLLLTYRYPHLLSSTLTTLQYIGCLGVNTSMKSLDFDTRSLIAKECINRVCEAAGLKTADKKRRTEKRITRMLADAPNMGKCLGLLTH